MLADDYGDDALIQQCDPNLDDDYLMLFERRKAKQPSQNQLGRYHNRRASERRHSSVFDIPEETPREKFESHGNSIGGEEITDQMFGRHSEKRPLQWREQGPPYAAFFKDVRPSSPPSSPPTRPIKRRRRPHSPDSFEDALEEDQEEDNPSSALEGGQPPDAPRSASPNPPGDASVPPRSVMNSERPDARTAVPPRPIPFTSPVGDKLSLASSSTFTSQESGLNQEIQVPPGLGDKPISDDIARQVIIYLSEDDLDNFKEFLPVLERNDVEIEKFNLAPYLLNNTFFENVLHYALKVASVNISKYLIEECPRELFLASCEVLDNVGRKRSKTCLHIIAERNLLDMAKLIFLRMKEKERLAYMNRKGEIRLGGHSFREISWFHVACYYGYIEIVKFCLEEGINPDETDGYGESGLFWACKKDEYETAELLLNKKADVNLVNRNGTPPLYMAVRHNSIKCVTLIMEYSPDVSAKRGVGFETPLILASAFGYEEIVQILVDSGADVCEPTSRGETAMHAAASEGWTKIMEILYNSPQGSDTINSVSKTKETPLHYAVAKNQMDAAQFLVERGADLNLKDKHGKTVWHVAVTSHKAPVLFTLLETAGHLNWEGKVSPLHLVAETPKSEEEFDVIKLSGMDMNTRDPEDNTYLHTAAKHGNLSVLRDGLGIISANHQNSSGNTPLHEAAKAGHLKAVKLLLRSCRLTILNESLESALHCAIKSPQTSADVVREIVKHMKNTNSMEVLNERNLSGNTALHLAAKYNRPEVVKHLKDISPSKLNNEGDSALHVAARRGNVEALKEILQCFEYEMKINQRTEDGETLLHLVAKGGYVEMISILIDHGINLAIQDETGNTFLHDLAEQAGADPENHDMYNCVFDEVVKDSLKWWCKLKNLTTVDEDSDLSLQRRKDALLYLRSEIINNDGLTALQVAVKHGASSLVEKMIQVPLVFIEKSSKAFKYDVTNLVPDTFIYKHESSTGGSEKSSSTESIPSIPETKAFLNGIGTASSPLEVKKQLPGHLKPVKASLLEVVVSKRPLNVANVMLDIEPLKQVADGYWMLYQLITSMLLILHVIHMAVLSAVAIPEIRKAANMANASVAANGTASTLYEPNPMFGFFLLWPLAIIVQEGYYAGNRIYRLVRKLDVSEPAFDEIRSDPKQPVSFSDGALALILYYMPHVVNVLFTILVFVWFNLYMSGKKSHGVLLAYVMLIGWLTTIAFTRTFRPMHSFTVMLRNIFIKDILKFLFLYVFILLAFGFAFDCLAQLSKEVYAEFKSTDEVFYQTIGMLLEAGDMMVDDIEDKYKASGHSPIHFKFLYLLYALVTVVVLLNILIAMMNDSYGDIKSKEGVSFRVLSIQQAIHFEKSLPFLHRVFKRFRQQQQQTYQENSRWYMKVDIDELPMESKADDKHVILHTLNSKLDKLSKQSNSIIQAVSSLRSRVEKLENPDQQMLIPKLEGGNETAAPVYKPDVYESERLVRFRVD